MSKDIQKGSIAIWGKFRFLFYQCTVQRASGSEPPLMSAVNHVQLAFIGSRLPEKLKGEKNRDQKLWSFTAESGILLFLSWKYFTAKITRRHQTNSVFVCEVVGYNNFLTFLVKIKNLHTQKYSQNWLLINTDNDVYCFSQLLCIGIVYWSININIEKWKKIVQGKSESFLLTVQ
jgi:hypothetical protein